MLETSYQYERIEAGCDEAGRGCLAGAVFAAAVILPPDFHDPLLNDSKQMTERNRDKLRAIIEREAVAWAVEAVSAARIDEINILNASFEGMCRAVGELRTRPEFLAIDGNRFRSSLDIPYRCIVKGDGKYADIAAASVLAKTHRDEYMRRLAEEFPQYGEESDRQTIDVGMRTLLFRPLVLRGRFCKRGGAVWLRLRKRDGFHRRRAGLCARSEFGCGGVRRSAGIRPLRVAEQSSTGFEPLRSGQREFFRTMVRM